MTQIETFLMLALFVTAMWLIFCMRDVEKCMDEICELWTAMRGAMELIDVLCEEREALQKERDAREDDLK